MDRNELKELKEIVEMRFQNSSKRFDRAMEDGDEDGTLWYESEMCTLQDVLHTIYDILDRE